jgi:hypothetical protein
MARSYILDWNNHRLRGSTDASSVHWVAGRGELGGRHRRSGERRLQPSDQHHLRRDPGRTSSSPRGTTAKVRIVDRATGTVTDTCGDGKRAYFGDEGPAEDLLARPAGERIAFDPAGNLTIMDQANQVLRYVDADGDTSISIAGRCVVDAEAPGAAPASAPRVSSPWFSAPTATTAPRASPCLRRSDDVQCSKPCTPGYSGDDIPAAEMRMSQPFGQSASPAGRIVYDKRRATCTSPTPPTT